MQIKDILNENVLFVDPDKSLVEVAKLMKQYECGSILVGREDKLIGVITDRDIAMRCVADSVDPVSMTAEQCMSPQVLYCRKNDDVEDVLRNMGENAVKRLPVVDEDKQLVGIVSFGDLSAACQDKACAGETMEQIRKAA